MKNPSLVILLMLIIIMSTLISWSSLASDADDAGNVVMDHYSYYRAFIRIVQQYMGKTASTVTPSQGVTSPLPPAEWMQSDFDDSTWYRTSGHIFPGHGWTRYRCPINVSVIFIRSNFFVGDPALAREISFSSQFRCGIIIYLNGKKVYKKHIASIAPDGEAITEEYPWNAYVTEETVKVYFQKGKKHLKKKNVFNCVSERLKTIFFQPQVFVKV